MDWVNQYVAAVKRNLPAGMRDEVGEELTDIILSNVEDKRESLGRNLSEEEMLTLLDSYGHPEKMAASYVGKQTLIGPQWFRLYSKVLPFVLMIVVFYHAAGGLLLVLSGEPVVLWHLVKNFAYEVFYTGILAAVVVTIIFYYLDSSPVGEKLLTRWRLQAMPKVDKPWIYIPMRDTLQQLGAAVLILFFLNSEVHLAQFLIQDGKSGSFVASEQIATIIPWLNGAILAFVVVRLVNLVRPYWSRTRLVANAAVMTLLALVLLPVLFSERIVVVSTTEVITAGGHHFTPDGMDITMRILISLFIALLVYELATAVHRLTTYYK